MRRALVLVAAVALILAGAALAGFWIATRLAPEQLRTALETRLAELLQTPVEIGEVRAALRYGAVLEAERIRAGVESERPALEVESLLARLDTAELLAGRLRIDWLVLDDALLRLERDAAGLRLAGAPAPAGEPEASAEPFRRAQAGLEELTRKLDSGPLAAARIEVRGGRLVVLDHTLAAAGEPPAVWGLEALDARLGERWMPLGSRLTARGRLRVAGEPRGTLALRGDSKPHPTLDLELQDLDLEALLGLLAPAAGRSLLGSAGGWVAWRAPADAPAQLDVDLSFRDVFLATGRRRSRWPRARLEAALEADAQQLRLVSARLSEGPAAVEASGTLGLPLSGDALLALRLRLRPISLTELADRARRVSGALGEVLDQGLGVIETGQVSEASLELRAPLERLTALVDAPLAAREGELRLRARVSDAALRLQDGDRVTGLAGRIDFRGDTLELSGVEARFAGAVGPAQVPEVSERPLPRLEARVSGLAHLEHDDAVQCLAPRAVPALPGRAVLNRALGERDESEPPLWSSLAIEADWVLHPALLCSLERVKARLRPADAGFEVEVEHGVWAGIPVQARGRFRAAPEDVVELEVELGPLWEPVGPYPDGEDAPWARGRYRMELARFGPWRTRQAEGAFRAEGVRLTLDETRLDLDPGGRLEGSFSLDFDSPEALPFRFQLQLLPIDLGDLSISMGHDPPQLTGTMVGGADIRSRIRPGFPSLAEADGIFSLHGRDGVIRRKLPAILAMTMAGDRLSPFPAKESIPYEAFELVLDVEDGRAYARSVRLDGPSVRFIATGEIGLVAPFPIESVVGVLFFRRLDAVIQRLPYLNRMLLGSDENLVNAYFALEGPWSGPEARLVPIKSLASGPASFLLEGFPSFVRGGLSRLRSILPGGDAGPAAGNGERADS